MNGEEVTISASEYSELVAAVQSAYYVYDIVCSVASELDDTKLMTAQEFARNLLDEWTK